MSYCLSEGCISRLPSLILNVCQLSYLEQHGYDFNVFLAFACTNQYYAIC